MWPVTWQFAALFIVVMTIDFAVRRVAWPQLRMALWSLLALKLILPPSLSVPFSGASLLFDVAPRANAIMSAASDPTPFVSSTGVAGLFVLWIAGVLVFGWLFIGRTIQLHRLLRCETVRLQVPHWLSAMHCDIAADLRLRCTVDLVVTDRVTSPALIGVRNPCILLPSTMVDSLTRSHIGNVLRHEMMHVKRGDGAFQALLAGLQIVYWFNPLVHLLRRRMSILQELGCDAAVARGSEERAIAYRGTLLYIARVILDQSRSKSIGLGFFQRHADLSGRIESLHRGSWKRGYGPTVAMIMLAMKAFVFPMAPAGDVAVDARTLVGEQQQDHRQHAHPQRDITHPQTTT